MMQALGIDISKETFDVCLIVEDKCRQEKFDNNPGGFKKLMRWMNKYQVQNIHACMEATGQFGEALAEYLYQEGLAVSVVNPARIKAYGHSKLRRNKTDKADAAFVDRFVLSSRRTCLVDPTTGQFQGPTGSCSAL